jgi:ribosome-associated protein
VIPEEELQWQFVRSQGPGGQHVNRASTKAVLRFHVVGSPSLSAAVRARLLEQQRSRLTDAGDLVITSQRFREQPRNIADCLDKLREMLERAAQRPRPRRPTRPTKGSVARRRLTKHGPKKNCFACGADVENGHRAATPGGSLLRVLEGGLWYTEVTEKLGNRSASPLVNA